MATTGGETRRQGDGSRGVTAGAAFLMATSAIGPGFLTQTAVFTGQVRADFAFAILASVTLALAVQLNVWRVLGASGRRAPELASAMVPGLGPALAALVAFGGLVFNVGNVAGCGLGLAVYGVPEGAGGPVRGRRRPAPRRPAGRRRRSITDKRIRQIFQPACGEHIFGDDGKRRDIIRSKPLAYLFRGLFFRLVDYILQVFELFLLSLRASLLDFPTVNL